jgi:hypothetical protein
MNTKTTFFATLSLILATSASAQVTSILPGGRGNLYIGTGVNLPGPVPNITISPRISLPAPLLAPSIVLVAAPAPTPAQTPIQIPNPVMPAITPNIPALPISAIPEHMWKLNSHESVLPYPALRAQLSAPAKDGSPKDSTAARGEKLDNLFDGRRKPAEKSDDLAPVRSDRHQSLPEQDLESEIGAY